MSDFALIGYGLTALMFMGLALLLVVNWRRHVQVFLLLFAVLVTAIWAGLNSFQASFRLVSAEWIWLLEMLHVLAWVVLLLRLLKPFTEQSPAYAHVLNVGAVVSLVVGLAMGLTLVLPEDLLVTLPDLNLVTNLRLVGQLLFVVFGLALVEQLFRNTPEEHRWGIKYLCFGLGAMFAYDFYFFTDALLFHRLDPVIWSARGAVYTMVVPLLAVSVSRNPDWSLPLFVSRRMVFHTTALFSAGIYMLLMAMAGYYIRVYGGAWGNVLQIVFLFGAFWVLVAMLFSGQLRSRVKVFLNKHFFNYQYDYREEWLHLIGLLSGQQTNMPLYERVIWAMSEIVDSRGGLLWLCQDAGACSCTAYFNHPAVKLPELKPESSLLNFLRQKNWVINLDEYLERPNLYEGLSLPSWLSDIQDAWLIVPLIHDEHVRGFVVLQRPRAKKQLNWENLDLLKTSGLQCASYIALQQAASALADARQFEGFNRLSAFVMHDLKNLVAQLSLVAKNAARHKHNPDFIDDAVGTIENSVGKMNRLMAQLRTARFVSEQQQSVDLVTLLRDLVDAKRGSRPEPKFEVEIESLSVLSEPDRLHSVIGHIIQNAQDATPPDGEVRVKLRSTGDQAIVDVLDNGSGMDQSFIEERLFKPFDSTKGLTGMGVGAYECREFVRAMGGQVLVDSTPGGGTHFSIQLPLISGPADTSAQTKTKE